MYGWIISVRSQKKFSFATLRCGEGEIACIIPSTVATDLKVWQSVRVEGEW